MNNGLRNRKVAGELQAARIAVAYIFFANGALWGTWVTRIPALMDKLGLTTTALGFAFFAAPFATILTMPLAGGPSAVSVAAVRPGFPSCSSAPRSRRLPSRLTS